MAKIVYLVLFISVFTTIVYAENGALLATCSCEIKYSDLCINYDSPGKIAGSEIRTFGVFENVSTNTSILITKKVNYYCDSGINVWRPADQTERSAYNAYGDVTIKQVDLRFMASDGNYVGAIKASGENHLNGHVWDWLYSENGKYSPQNATCEAKCTHIKDFHSF